MKKRLDPFETMEPALPPPPCLDEKTRVENPRRRNRQWERKNQSHKAVYRGVDPKLALRVKSIAGEVLLPEGEVARAVIQFALREYQEGGFDLFPKPDPYRMRMTLFPTKPRRLDTPRRSRQQKPPEQLWRVITTWRGFPPELKQELAQLASHEGLNVPIGELITALLHFGLQAYDYGVIQLPPAHQITTCTLETGDKK